MEITTSSNIETLPEDCVCTILSHLSPAEACRFSLVSPTLRSAADSDMVWKGFLPSDYKDIVSRSLNPLSLKFSSYKQLFYAFSHPLLLDDGNKSFKLDKYSGKKSYILSSKELSITWSSDPLYWSWRQTPESRFTTVAELRTVHWLQIEGKMRRRALSRNTSYAAYLIMKVSSSRGYGLDYAPCEVSVTVGNRVVQRGRAYLCEKDEKKRTMEMLLYGNRSEMMLRNNNNMEVNQGGEEEKLIGVPSKREDGWMEIELGEFFSGEGDDDDDDDEDEDEDEDEVKFSLMEVGYQLKGGLIIEGIEVRPASTSLTHL